MRPVLAIDLHRRPLRALACAALVLGMLSTGVKAQESGALASADAGVLTVASTQPVATPADAAPAVSEDRAFVSDAADGAQSFASGNLGGPDIVLDDQALSHQRGGFGGMLMVVATPQMMRGVNNGNNVTLWDEIAPPSPLPVPADVARSAQGNVTTYQRN
jgi:hypothetical protein